MKAQKHHQLTNDKGCRLDGERSAQEQAKFLVDNTLGRIWYEMCGGKTSLTDKCQHMARHPNEVFLNSKSLARLDDARPWLREVASGNFAAAREDANWEEISAVALMLDGYEVAQQLHGKNIVKVVDPMFEELERDGKPGSHPLVDLWILLFACQRSILREGDHNRDPELGEQVRSVWKSWCAAAVKPPETEGLSQEALQKQAVIIPVREPKDPREICLLDPACGSLRLGEYAFEVFATIYREAKELRRLGKDAYAGDRPALDPASVCKRIDLTMLPGNDIGKVEAATACIAILEQGDFGDGLNHEGPYLTKEGRNFRPKVIKQIAWSEFDFQKALSEGWMTVEQSERLIRETKAFTHNRIAPLPYEEQARFLEAQIPRMIIEHNLCGIDTDPQAIASAKLALLQKAQESWQQAGIETAERPPIEQTSIRFAESISALALNPHDEVMMYPPVGKLPSDLKTKLDYLFYPFQLRLHRHNHNL
jgi:hypothetical protein